MTTPEVNAKRVFRNERVLTAVDGGFALKPAPSDGWKLGEMRFITDEEVFALSKLIAAEQGETP